MIKWLGFMSSFVLNKMCSLITPRVRTDKGFKEVHLTIIAKALKEHSGAEVSSTQVCNHLRKWRVRWLTVIRLLDLSGAQWCEDTKTIIMESENYTGHVTISAISSLSFDYIIHHCSCIATNPTSSNVRITPRK
jgi:hypothetical protein